MVNQSTWIHVFKFISLMCFLTSPTSTAEKGAASASTGSCSSPDNFQCSSGFLSQTGELTQKADANTAEPLCVPSNWVCDGDRDCPNGDDEEQNCTISQCASNEFECLPNSKTHCISKTWQCDGEKDCENGEDEAPEICVLVDTFKCLPNHFRCPGTRTCIHMTQVCNSIVECQVDSADEGPFCINRACRSNCPNAKCKETFQGAMCYCPEGQEYNGSACKDVNECNYDSFFCDQKCQNTEGSYTCSCVSGYKLVGKGQCHVADDPPPRLVMANFHSVKLLHLSEHDEPHIDYSITGFKIAALDVDIWNKSVCWVTYLSMSETSHFVCASVDSFNQTWEVVIPYALDNVKAVAKEWLSGNWYFADDLRELIFMCTSNGSHCRPVITKEIRRPRSLAIDSTKGYLFFSDWSNSPYIGRVHLDGSHLYKLAEIKIVHPNGLTVDIPNSHLYWGDSFLDVIERIDYYRNNRMVIAKGADVFHMFGMTILENYLYVANHLNNSIVKIHRFNSSVPDTVVKKSQWKPGTIKIYHRVVQPVENSTDVCRHRSCDQVCIPVPVNNTLRAVCECYLGYRMVNDTCQKENTTRFILMTNGQQGMVHSISTVPKEADRDVYPPVINLKRPSAVDFDAVERYIYFSDVAKHTIGRRKIDEDVEPEIFMPREANCDGLAVDWVGRNLYCADSSRNGSIIAISLRNSSNVYTVFDSAKAKKSISPKALVVDPRKGVIYWTEWVIFASVGNGSINKMNMDGSNWTVITDEKVQWPNGLVLDPDSDTLYWTDAFYDQIESMSTNGSNRTVILKFQTNQHSFGLTKLDNTLWWADSMNGSLMQLDLTKKVPTFHRSNSPPVYDVKLYDGNSQKPLLNHPCQTDNGGCSDLCLVTSGGGHVCRCADGRQTSDNGVTCTGEVAPAECQKISVFRCGDGHCVDPSLVCNGEPDCPDHSDEDKGPNGVCGKQFCPPEMSMCIKSNTCIYQHFFCDGEVDCAFGDDESNCTEHTCGSDYMQCAKSQQCILLSWKCDGERDCPDGSDEGEQCCQGGKCGPGNCTAFQFTCLDGRCIDYRFRCDNEYDCPDHSDELDCGSWCDPWREFKCANDSRCLPRLFQCDGEVNCADGSDEKDCEIRQRFCHREEFACLDGTCIRQEFRCDGNTDCFDGSDEQNCSQTKTLVERCHWTQFTCDDRTQCIPAFWQCDEEFDCRDKSDEKHCDKQCQPPMFACESHPNMCLAPEKLCDNVNDCPDHSDEGRLCEYDMCLNNDCEEKCHKSPKGIVCSCGENKRLKSDLKTCVDINICEKWGICSQQCVPTPQGHRCMCNEGYSLRPDGYSCKPNDAEPVYIIFSNRHEIRRLNVHNNTLTSLVSGLRNTIAIDFHYEQQLIFWTDVIDDKIYRGNITHNSVTKIEPIIEFGLATTEGVAVDWIANNIYWVESNLDQIEVAKLDGSDRTTLIAGNMTSPRAIVLDPKVGKLFWTDWDGAYPRIETCSMAGEQHTRDVVYDIRNYKGAGWPNGLAVDYESQRLYWVDARSDSIHSITYQGQDHQMILKSHRTLNHPFSLTVFEHYVYWTDWRFNTLVVANKFNGSDVSVVQRTYTQPFDLQVYHPKRQPKMNNPCKDSRCSHLCLIGDGLKPVCQCPHRFKLSADNVTCKGDNTFLLFAKENEIRGVDLDNAHYNVIPSITVPFVENATSIDYDALEERLYWTDLKKNVITSAYLNGTGITTVIDSGLSNPLAFAIDWISRNMYFSSYTENEASISVAKLDGAFRKEIYSKNNSKPNSMVIHPSLGVMFWSDLGESEHSIWKANMDGKQSAVIARGDAVRKPASLALDLESNLLYWINREEEAIYSCNITSIMCQPIREKRFPIVAPISMTIYKSSLKEGVFLFSANKTSIMKVYKGNTVVMRGDTPNVFDLMVYDPSSRKGKTNVCSENNGGCEQLCLPSGKSRVCECTIGYQKDESSGGVKCKGIHSFLLYSQSSEIHGVTIDDKAGALAPISKISLATSVDFHAANDHIYWVDSDRRIISRIKRDLSDRETIVSDGISGAESLAVDWIAGNIYWTDQGHNCVEVATLNGENRYVIFHEDIEKPRSIVVHPAKGYMYFANGGARPRIVRARLDGSERTDFVVSTKEKPVKAPYGLAIDYKTDDLYWCDKDNNSIERVTPKGERITIVSTNLTDCMSLTVFGDRIYWADVTDMQGSIKYANKNTGQDIRVMLKEISRLKDIKVFDASIQTGSNPCMIDNGGCEGLCLYRGHNEVTCACSHGKLAADGKSCEDYDAFLVYSEVTALKSLPLHNTTNLNAPRLPIQNESFMKNVIGLTFDYLTQRIFFSDIQQGNILSVFFNGTGFQTVLPGVGSAEGLTFDSVHRHLYWTSYSGSSVNRIIFSSQTMSEHGQKNEVFVQLETHDHPRDIVVNSCVRRVFWTNWSDQRPSIQTAAFDSRGRMNGTESIITERIRTPNGLTMDYKANKLYWSDARLDKIERCDFDGNNRIVIVTTIPQHSFGLAVYGNFLYWTDWMLRAVIRASKYDGSDVTWLKRNINRQPMGIIAIAADSDNCTLNPCYKNAFGCSEICMVDERGDASCRCSEGKKLIGGKKCVFQSVERCEEKDFICEDHKLCIPFDKTCNNISDCLDASDESSEYCNNRRCPVGWYQCHDNRQCIPQSNVCDGWNDCVGGSDEHVCPCAQNEFRCTNGMCILDKYKCDYDSDCPDHSDEIGCNKTCDGLEISGVKHHGLVPCNTTSMCIYPSWICDGSNDCWDNNDEVNCGNVEPGNCAENAFMCANGNCILPQWRCDKEADCADGSDELNCTYTCDADQHKCNDHTCIPISWVCDGHPDCPDHSDEPENCTQQNCTEEHFQCPSGRCISKEWLCDGDHDCPNGEDERIDDIAKCAPIECAHDQFLCLNRHCVKSTFYCDGENDCGDSSDEPDTCVYVQCADDEFACRVDKRVRCMKQSKRCNGWIDCPDHSDEKDCPNTSLRPANLCHNATHFRCNNSMCIEDTLVCNGNNDCGDSSDEPSNCHINECNSKRPVCSQICVNKKIGYECQCNPGYQLEQESLSNKEVSPNKKCVDVNECNTSLPCSHYCANTIGSFKCSCADGYRLLKDGKSCMASEPEPLILISNRYYLRLISTTRSTNNTVTTSLNNSVAVDYDWKGQMIYWSDITSDRSSISRMGFNFTSRTKLSEPEVLHNNTVRNPDGLAVDWIGRNLYWCDKTTDTIEVSRLDGRYRKILLREGLQEPRALEVFPQKGLLFFTDWGDRPHISRMNMDGTDVRQVVSESIAWPNALTIDYVTEKIFWGDGNLDYIGMADLDGQNARVIVGDNKKTPHVFALTTFEGLLYWTDWENKGVFYTAKFSGHNVTSVVEFVHRPMDIQIVHPLRQVPLVDKQGLSVCDYLGCSHLCLLRADEDGQGVKAVCSCPENHYLSPEDGRSCISNCTTSQFLCAASSKCIPFWWRCDNHTDCEDGSDEPANSCGPYHCSHHGMFQCLNGTSEKDCFLPTHICDGIKHCTDSSDESICDTYTCMEHYMKCQKDRKCIPKTKVCDGASDCSDGQDEKNCTTSTCTDSQFMCANLRCVPYVWKCDNDDDCGDGSDEPAICKSETCRKGHFKCNKTGRCIPEAWKCDGDQDCGEHDSSDEDQELCHSQTCDPTFFRCNNGHCIPGRWRCDYFDDCRDGSDEISCIDRECSESEFRCNNKCIPGRLKCNGMFDCVDRSDEMDCNPMCDNATQFQCDKISHCIPKKWVCDGDTDCTDGTDEWNCNRNCTENEFKCDNSICQPNQWRCDGDDDCGDNSDEREDVCAKYACPPGRFRCKNHKCIWNSMVCDRKNDCPDGEDEEITMCAVAKNCPLPNFLCESRTECLHPRQVCDGLQDCRDGSDEDKSFCNTLNVSKTDSCSIFNGGCEHHCTETQYGPQCSCKEFHILNSDGLTCSFDNPCDHHGTCSQKCEFDKNNMHIGCSCEKGYVKVKDNPKACIAIGEPHILIAEKDNLIMRKHLHSNETEDVTFSNAKNDSKLSQVIAIDVDLAKNTVFFINQSGTEYFLMKSQLASNSPNLRKKRQTSNKPAEILHLSDRHFDMTGLAVDWISQNIYLTDTTGKAIYRYNYDGQRGKVVAKGDITSPYSVAVDPIAGYIFWTDRGSTPKIERANLDGSDRKVIVATEMSWPSSLALDPTSGWVYWTDTKKYTVESARYDGSGRQIIHNSACFSSDAPQALAVFEDYIYVLTHKLSQVLKLHKFKNCTHHKVNILFNTLHHARDITIIHDSKQPKVNSNCTPNACNPEESCFNKPQDARGYVCLCPDGAEKRGKKCEFEKLDCASFCLNGGNCTMSKVSEKRKCSCPSGYLGERCEQYVCTDYCQNGGICTVDLQNKPICLCSPLHDGDKCEIEKPLDFLCPKVCKNGARCHQESSGYIACVCEEGFTGKRCEQCFDLICDNGGSCYKKNGQSKCDCPPDLDPKSQCRSPLNCTSLCLSGVSVESETCDCGCKTTYLAKDCACETDCQHGKCRLENGKPKCVCHELYKGENCDICKCEPSGTCEEKSKGEIACNCGKDMFGKFCEYSCADVCGTHAYCTQCQLNKTTHKAECLPESCVCNPGFSGPACELSSSASQQGGSGSMIIIIIVACVAVVVIGGTVFMVLLVKKRTRRTALFGHKRMDEQGNMNITNPVYMKRDEDEEEPMSGGVIFTGDGSTNFTNPMYGVYSNDSTQKLLSDFSTEENHNCDDLQVHYVPTDHLLQTRDGARTTSA